MPDTTLIHPNENELARLTQLSYAFLTEEGAHKLTESDVEQELLQLFDQGFQALVYIGLNDIQSFCLFDVRRERVHVKRLYTSPAFRRQGIATRFLNTLRRYDLPVSFFVASNNASAIAFYKRLGAVEKFRAFELSP